MRIIVVCLALFAISSSIACRKAMAAERMAIVIGISQYSSLTRLSNPVRDAEMIADLLSKNGFAVRHAKEIDYDSFRQILKSFKSETASAKEVVVYFAGHGMTVLSGNQLVNVLAASDTRINCETRAAERSVLMDDILESVAHVLKQAIFFDSCRDNPIAGCESNALTEALKGYQPANLKGIRGLSNAGATRSGGGSGDTRLDEADKRAPPSILLGYSTGLGKTAADGPPGGHSPFALYLSEELLAQPQAPLRSILESTSRRLANLGQRPWAVTEGGEPEMCLAGANCQNMTKLSRERFAAQSRQLSQHARTQREAFNYATAGLLALEAIGVGGQLSDAALVSTDAIPELELSLRGLRETMVAQTTRNQFKIELIPGTSRFVSYGDDVEPLLWDQTRIGSPIRLKGLPGTRITKLAVDASGTTVSAASDEGHIAVWAVETSHLIQSWRAHGAAISALAMHPDRVLVASAARGEAIQVTDIRTAKVVATLGEHKEAVWQIAFSRSGDLMMSNSRDLIGRWSTLGFRERRTESLEGAGALLFDMTASGERALLAGPGYTRVYEFAARKEIELKADGIRIKDAVLSPDGELAATTGWSSAELVRLWNTRTGVLAKTLRGINFVVQTARFSADGRHVYALSGSDSKPSVAVWEVNSGNLVALLNGPLSSFRDAAVLNDGTTVATLSDDGTLRFWRIPRRNRDWNTATAAPALTDAQLADQGKALVTFAADGSTRVWDVSTGQVARTFAGGTKQWSGLGASADGRRFLSAERASGTEASKPRALVRDFATGSTLLEVTADLGTFGVSTLAPDGRHVAISTRNAIFDQWALEIWNVDSKSRVGRLDGHTGWVAHLEFSSDSQQLLSFASLRDLVPRLWHVPTAKLLAELRGHTAPITMARLSPDGRYVVASSPNSATTLVWDSTTAAVIKRFETLASPPLASPSPDGTLLAVQTSSQVEIWDTRTWAQRFLIPLPRGVAKAVFSPDGSRIAIHTQFDFFEIWRTDEGTRLHAFRGLADRDIGNALFSPDGRLVYTTKLLGGDQVRAWDVETGLEIARFATPDKSTIDTGILIALGGQRLITRPPKPMGQGHAWTWSAPENPRAVVAQFKMNAPRCLTPAERAKFGLPPEPPRWCIMGADHTTDPNMANWRPLWPYGGEAWARWQKSVIDGRPVPIPK